MVFPSGEFTTTIPWRVAAFTSILSTPTPARPIILSLVPASITSAVTLVPDRNIKASYSGIILISSSKGSLVFTSTSATCEMISIPAGSIGSETRTFAIVMNSSLIPLSLVFYLLSFFVYKPILIS